MDREKTVIEAEALSFQYEDAEKQTLHALSFAVRRGEFVAVLGRNGCGKSTLAKLLNALLPLQEGRLIVAGINAAAEASVWELRREVGMVFQNPDNQFVSSIVSEDVSFGLENYGTQPEQLAEKVRAALAAVGMEAFAERETHRLSGGQKQRVALAGVLALDPQVLVFDEATSMLDPQGRAEILEQMHRVNKEQGRTVLMITHYAEEAAAADRIFVMGEGRLLAAGTPREIFGDETLLTQAGLLPPVPARLYHDLRRLGVTLGRCPLTEAELAEELCRAQMGGEADGGQCSGAWGERGVV